MQGFTAGGIPDTVAGRKISFSWSNQKIQHRVPTFFLVLSRPVQDEDEDETAQHHASALEQKPVIATTHEGAVGGCCSLGLPVYPGQVGP